MEGIYERGVLSTEFSLPDPKDGPFLLFRLISTTPFMLYFAEGEETLLIRKLSLLEPPKEKPFAGLSPAAIDLHWLRDSLCSLSRYLELDKELSPCVFDTFLLT